MFDKYNVSLRPIYTQRERVQREPNENATFERFCHSKEPERGKPSADFEAGHLLLAGDIKFGHFESWRRYNRTQRRS